MRQCLEGRTLPRTAWAGPGAVAFPFMLSVSLLLWMLDVDMDVNSLDWLLLQSSRVGKRINKAETGDPKSK